MRKLHRALSVSSVTIGLKFATALLVLGATVIGCQSSQTDLNMPQEVANPMVVPSNFPPPIIPATNELTSNKVDLGRRLFYEVKLSRDNSKSCGSCHQASAGFSDGGKAVSIGVFNQRGSRNALALANIAYRQAFFWDGRATTLEQQATMPITNPIEMASDSTAVVSKLNADPFYKKLFSNAFGDANVTFERIGQAIASFERTMMSGSSDFDRFDRGDSSALSDAAKRGLALFKSPAVNCIGCHKGFNFTDEQYHSTGLEANYEDIGREQFTGNNMDNGKFHTPSLRNIDLTAPYMHDGRFTNLQQVLDHYNEGGKHNFTQDSLIKPLHLKQAQMDDIIAFLKSLTDREFASRKSLLRPN